MRRLILTARAAATLGRSPRTASGEQGNVALVVALMATALIGMGALAIDVGAMLVRQSQLQSGADAAAMAVARQCAGFVVDNQPASCDADQALATASDYFSDNLPGIAADVAQPTVATQYDSRAGVVTVSAGTQEPTMFGWALGAGSLDVRADATARWGPMTAVDDVFPLAICKGALPEPNQEVTLWSSVEGNEMLGECDGAPTALPMGWLTPTDTTECTTDITLLPKTYLEVAPSNEPPSNPGCTDAINRLLDGIRSPPGRCRRVCRTRVLAVYDASRAPGGSHPAYSLVAFEFTGARLGSRAVHRERFGPWEGVCAPEGPYPVTEDLQCIRGVVRLHDPPDDGPILDLDVLDVLAPGGISDSTVLDVRLVD